jgi:small subunit ribosomal protein S1
LSAQNGGGFCVVSYFMEDLVKKFSLPPEEVEKQANELVGNVTDEQLAKMYEASIKNFEPDTILPGRVINIVNDEVIVDVGYKSEGSVSLRDFEDPSGIDVGDALEVLLEAAEDESGTIVLSKSKADRIRGWERLVKNHKEGDIIKGKAVRKIKGGLLVDVGGVSVFLPASQVGIRRAGDIAEYIGKELECKIIKIDAERRNIVVSRRKLLEEQRAIAKRKLLEEIKVGDSRKGVVKNIADFGAFVDLGGIDGLLHITDMSWGRISHPSEMLAIDDEIEVRIIGLDLERERIALGLKQKSESPWANIEQKYPIGSRVKGEVVNIMSYGAFVKLEEGVEGLVHISEMSWTKRVNHPSEVAAVGDIVEVIVLDINTEKQEISLGMKQTEVNPWTMVEEKYPPGTVIEGRVRNLTNYGTFIEIEEGIDGLLHVSDMSWTKKINHPSEIVKKGEKIKTVILSVDQEKKRVALGLKQLYEDPWENDILNRYHEGDIVEGKIAKLASFGAFVELEKDLEGLLHVSELSSHKITSPEEAVQVGQTVRVQVIRVDKAGRKIGLSMKRIEGEEVQVKKAGAEGPVLKPVEMIETHEPPKPEEKAPAAPTAEPAAEPKIE